ncbi:hypothetical protein EMIT0P258_50007 [Pseudomonas sp. IT-P258]
MLLAWTNSYLDFGDGAEADEVFPEINVFFCISVEILHRSTTLRKNLQILHSPLNSFRASS